MLHLGLQWHDAQRLEERVEGGQVVFLVPLQVTRVCRILPLLRCDVDPAFPPVLDQFLCDLSVAHHVIVAKQEQSRSGDGGFPEDVDAHVEVVHRLPFEHEKVQQTCLFHQLLPAWKYSLAEP